MPVAVISLGSIATLRACSNASTPVVKVRTVVSLLAVASWLLLAVLSGMALHLQELSPQGSCGMPCSLTKERKICKGMLNPMGNEKLRNLWWSGLNARLSKIGSARCRIHRYADLECFTLNNSGLSSSWEMLD